MPSETTKTIRVEINGGTPLDVAPGTTLRDLLSRWSVSDTGPDPIGAKVNNKIADLSRELEEDCRVEFFDLTSRDGNLLYQRSLCFLLVMAVRKIFPDLKVYINHVLGDGYFCAIHAPGLRHGEPVQLTEEDLGRIEAEIRALVDRDLPFERVQVSVEEARRIFADNGQPEKVELLRYRTDPKISLYRCGDAINHFCGYLLPRTGMVKVFALTPCPPGFLLRFPHRSDPTQLEPFVMYPKLFRVIREFEEWNHILGLEVVPQLNRVIESGGVSEFIKVAEALHEKKIAGIADQILERRRQVRLVLISGPSSSGKTTFSKRLAVQLRVNGLKPVIVHLDDFFVDRDRTPRDASGDFDFEAFATIDSELLADCVHRLLRGDCVTMPRFDFKSGKSQRGDELQIDSDHILLIEGIHALNPDLLPRLPEGLKFHLFTSALTALNIDHHNRISSSDTRMIRRIVRDSQYRGYSAEETIGRWPSVRRGEGRNIFPYQERADVIFNTALTYELAALRRFAMPILQEITPERPVHSEARRILYLLSYFRDIEVDEVPRHSLLREFIGDSSFDY
ncbi:nucleoside kinase [Candidatus Sumerlaeota bacterium]|nr:nucleoside kinase [Candidatus Sumerlaeota bacterium]